MELISPADLEPFAAIAPAKCAAMIADVTATALLHAPAIEDLDDPIKLAAVKAILRGSILRWHSAGDGGITTRQHTAGPFSESETVEQRRTGMFYPSEIEQLKTLVKPPAKAFTFDLAPGQAGRHRNTCASSLGARYCDCGYVLAGRPIFGR